MNNGRDCEHGQLARSCDRCADAAEIAELRKDADRWRYVATHWSEAQIHWNRDQTFKSMVLTIKAKHPATSSAVAALAQEIDAAMALPNAFSGDNPAA